MKRLWIVLAIVMIFGFLVLGWVGTRIYQEMPPIPDAVVTADGQVVIASGDIARGQSVWQAMGGMEVGSIWGHGSYVAPDWTADWLHRECEVMLNDWSVRQFGMPYDSVWNLVGAGLFGFMINPPIALYYMQGLNTTPVHGHGALFGVYGLLGIGLTLMCLRALMADQEWKEGLLKFSFWSMNIGLMLMILLSLLPVGLLQTWASVQNGYWYARSPEFMGTGLMTTLRWLRVPGDTLFAIGAIAFVLFIFGLKFGYFVKPSREVPDVMPSEAVVASRS